MDNKSPGTNIYASRALNLAIFEGDQRKSPVEDLGTALRKQGLRESRLSAASGRLIFAVVSVCSFTAGRN